MKNIFKKIHLWLSIPVGLIISVICLTGALLVFEKEMTRIANPHLYWVDYTEGSVALKPSEIVSLVGKQVGDTLVISSMQIAGEPDEAWIVSFENAGRRQLSVNPYTGVVNGWIQANPFFSNVRKLHRWLLDAPASKGASSVGKMIVGVSTLLMVVILVSGLVIWWPRSRQMLKNRLKVVHNKGTFRFWYDIHVSVGFYATILLLLMALTGLTWSFQWYRTGFYALFGASTKTVKPVKNVAVNERDDVNPLAWDNVVAELQERYAGYGTIALSGSQAEVIQPGKRNGDTVVFDGQTGAVTGIKAQNADSQPVSNDMKGFIFSLHTGLWGGMVTRVLYLLAALVGGVLPLTGYYMWIKRLLRKRRQAMS